MALMHSWEVMGGLSKSSNVQKILLAETRGSKHLQALLRMTRTLIAMLSDLTWKIVGPGMKKILLKEII